MKTHASPYLRNLKSRQVTAQVKSTVYEHLLWLPQDYYTDEEVSQRTLDVYQHIFTNYHGNGESVYGRVG